MVAALARTSFGTPDLGAFRRRYPLTVANLGALANREAWLRRIWELDEHWQAIQHNQASVPEVITSGPPPANLEVEAEFEAIYAGGGLGLLHAATLAHRYGRRVMVFDAHAVGHDHYLWHISEDGLKQFAAAGLFTPDELQTAIVNRPRAGLVKFHDANSRIKAPPLWLENAPEVTLEAAHLLALAARKIQHANGLLVNGARFVRACQQGERVCVETEDVTTGRRRLFAARLFVDAMGAGSTPSQQLNQGRRLTHLGLMAGTVARGFVHGSDPGQVDFTVSEIIVSNEDAADQRQLFWHSRAGSPQLDEYLTCLSFYDEVGSSAEKSLLELFERYFEKLPKYKWHGAHWRVIRPVFGYRPGSWHSPQTAENRVLLIGDAAGLSHPFTFGSDGGHLCDLQRLAGLTEQALADDTLDQAFLAGFQARPSRLAQLNGLSELLRPLPHSSAHEINETLNAVVAALHSLDENARRELAQGHLPAALLIRTVRTYPAILQRLRERLGVLGMFRWLVAVFSREFSVFRN